MRLNLLNNYDPSRGSGINPIDVVLKLEKPDGLDLIHAEIELMSVPITSDVHDEVYRILEAKPLQFGLPDDPKKIKLESFDDIAVIYREVSDTVAVQLVAMLNRDDFEAVFAPYNIYLAIYKIDLPENDAVIRDQHLELLSHSLVVDFSLLEVKVVNECNALAGDPVVLDNFSGRSFKETFLGSGRYRIEFPVRFVE